MRSSDVHEARKINLRLDYSARKSICCHAPSHALGSILQWTTAWRVPSSHILAAVYLQCAALHMQWRLILGPPHPGGHLLSTIDSVSLCFAAPEIALCLSSRSLYIQSRRCWQACGGASYTHSSKAIVYRAIRDCVGWPFLSSH